MAVDGLFSNFGKVPQCHTPYFSSMIQCLIACIFVFLGSLSPDLLGCFTLVLLLKNTLTQLSPCYRAPQESGL